EIYLLQRKKTPLGEGLGKTSGWVHRAQLKKHAVRMLRGVQYKSVTDEGLWIEVDGHAQLLRVDSIVVCAGQESVKDLMPLAGEIPWHNIILLVGLNWLPSWMPSVPFVKEPNWPPNCRDLMKLYAVNQIHCNFHLSVT